MTRHATPRQPGAPAATLEQLAERKNAAWRAAWTAMAAWIEASPERRKGKIQAAVDAAADAYLTAADAWRVARDNE